MARTKSRSKGKYWKDYQKERQRISRQLKRMEGRGYYWDKDILPPIPKRVTQASVNRLKKLKTDDIYRKARYLDRETGEIMIGLAGRKHERHLSAMRGAETRRRAREYYEDNERYFNPPESTISISMDDVFIANFRSTLENWNEALQGVVNNWIDYLIDQYGRHNVAVMLADGTASGCIITYQEAYDSSKLKDYMAEMIDFLPEVSEWGKDEINEYTEELLFEGSSWSELE